MEKLRAVKSRLSLALSKFRRLQPRQTVAAMPGAQEIEMRVIIPKYLTDTHRELNAHRVEVVENPSPSEKHISSTANN